jgi:hypothetical protein
MSELIASDASIGTKYFPNLRHVTTCCPHTRRKSLLGMLYAHAQDFSAGDELLLAILKAFIPLLLNKQQTIGFHMF